MKLYVIAGEASGDMHAANLMESLLAQNKDIDFRFWGGDRMQEVAGKPVKHIKELAFMGFVEVLMNLRTILGNIKICQKDILEYKPDAIILVDYPGFNLRIAKFAKENGIKVLYYISPQVWAWKEKRVNKIKATVDHMFVILPFEKEFYAKHGMKVHYNGHPLLDEIKRFSSINKSDFRSSNGLSGKPIIALLPGSRKQEIKIKLPIMLSVIDQFSDYQFVIAGAPSQDKLFYDQFITKDNVSMVKGVTYSLLSNSHAALVTSGTATLETALFNVPEVVCYKGSAISYQIAKRLIKVPYISLVNLIANREVVKELIQSELNAQNLKRELELICSGYKREKMLQEYVDLRELLGGDGASDKIATEMLKTLS